MVNHGKSLYPLHPKGASADQRVAVLYLVMLHLQMVKRGKSLYLLHLETGLGCMKTAAARKERVCPLRNIFRRPTLRKPPCCPRPSTVSPLHGSRPPVQETTRRFPPTSTHWWRRRDSTGGRWWDRSGATTRAGAMVQRRIKGAQSTKGGSWG